MENIKQLYRKAREMTLSPKEVLSSLAFKSMITSMIHGVTKIYNRVIDFELKFVDSDDFVACTDNNKVLVNANFLWIRNAKTIMEKIYLIEGFVLHETGHLLWTDFSLLKESLKQLSLGTLYPEPTGHTEIKVWLKKHSSDAVISLYKSFDNCVEDGYIERFLVKLFPGYAECLEKVRKLHQAELCSDCYDGEGDPVAALVNLTLIYSKYGDRNIAQGFENSVTKAFDKMMGHLDFALDEKDARMRKKHINEAFCLLLELIKEESKNQQQNQGQQGQQGQSSENNDSQSDNSANENSDSDSDSGNAGGVPSLDDFNDENDNSSKNNSSGSEKDEENTDSDDNTEENSKENSESNSENDSKENSESSSENDSKEESKSNSKKNSEKKSESNSENNSKEDPTDVNSSKDNSSNKSKSLEEALNELAEKMKENLEKTEDQTQRNNAPMQVAQETNSDIQQNQNDSDFNGKVTMQNIEEKAALEKVEKQRLNEVNKWLQDIANKAAKTHHMNYRSGAQIRIMPLNESEVPNFDRARFDTIARRTMKGLDKIIKERQIGDEDNGLYFGQMLDTDTLYRNDKKHFKSKCLPEDIPDMEVLVMIDLSGSMSGEKIRKAKECAYITWKFCTMLDIPCSVYGHRSISGGSAIIPAIDSNELKPHPENIFKYTAGNGNYDALAMEFSAERLRTSTAKDRLLIFISDGMPCTGAAGYVDLHSTIEKCRKEGITVITAAVDDAECIKDVYFNNTSSKQQPKFMDLSDLERLPKAFIEVIKKIID